MSVLGPIVRTRPMADIAWGYYRGAIWWFVVPWAILGGLVLWLNLMLMGFAPVPGSSAREGWRDDAPFVMDSIMGQACQTGDTAATTNCLANVEDYLGEQWRDKMPKPTQKRETVLGEMFAYGDAEIATNKLAQLAQDQQKWFDSEICGLDAAFESADQSRIAAMVARGFGNCSPAAQRAAAMPLVMNFSSPVWLSWLVSVIVLVASAAAYAFAIRRSLHTRAAFIWLYKSEHG